MSVIPLAIYLCELALLAIILWFVIEAIHMPMPWSRVCQILIVLIAVFAAINAVLGAAPAHSDGLLPLHPLSPSNPSRF
jgi:hypothetical protein